MSAPDAVPWRERLRGLPNMIGMALSIGLFAFGVLVATVPFDADSDAGGVDGAVLACGSPVFELIVPAEDGQMARTVPISVACRDEASSRVLLGLAAMGLGVVGAIATSQIRKRRYDPRRYDLIDARAR